MKIHVKNEIGTKDLRACWELIHTCTVSHSVPLHILHVRLALTGTRVSLVALNKKKMH